MKKMAFITNYFEEFNFESGGERAFYEFVKKYIDEGNVVDIYCTKHKTPKHKNELNENYSINK